MIMCNQDEMNYSDTAVEHKSVCLSVYMSIG